MVVRLSTFPIDVKTTLAAPGPIGSTTPAAITATTVTAGSSIVSNAGTGVDGFRYGMPLGVAAFNCNAPSGYSNFLFQFAINGTYLVWGDCSGNFNATSGTFTGALKSTTLTLTASQAAATVLAAPSGEAGAPTFRQLASVDITQAGSILTSGASVTMTAASTTLIVRKTTGSATAVTLPASPLLWQTYVIKDGKGDAATNPITITPSSGSIDGASSVVLSIAYGAVNLEYDGTTWNVVFITLAKATAGGIIASSAYSPSAYPTYNAPGTAPATNVIDATNLVITFTAPASGIVLIRFSVYLAGGSGAPAVFFAMRDTVAAADVSGSLERVTGSTTAIRVQYVFKATGLTSGASYTWAPSYATNVGTANSVNLFVGGTGATGYGPATIEVVAD